MLMGVLVIAFPVSVFSDLWSHELKQVKGFEDLNDDDDESTGPFSRQAPKQRLAQEENPEAPMNESSVLRQDPPPPPPPLPRHPQSPFSVGTYHRDTVVMDKEDLKELVECVYSIKENQRQLTRILRKYRLYDEDQDGF